VDLSAIACLQKLVFLFPSILLPSQASTACLPGLKNTLILSYCSNEHASLKAEANLMTPFTPFSIIKQYI
jgi:hypothetical protein